MRRRLIAYTASLPLLAATACIPAVMHGPRIEPGLTTGVAASYTAGPRRTRGDMGGVAYAYGPVGLDGGYGWTSGQVEGLGVRLGIHLPVPLVLAVQSDLYVQIPRRAILGLDGGVGVTAAPVISSLMPYAQLGVLGATGTGVYGTYGVSSRPRQHSTSTSPRGRGSHAPGLAFQKVNGRTTTRFFVTALIARDRECPDQTIDCDRKGDWAVASGLALQYRHRKSP